MEKVLVTGAAGFIGSRLVKALVANAENVMGLDALNKNLASGNVVGLGSITNLMPMDVRLLCCDISDQLELRRIFSSWKPSVVFHMAAISDTRCKDEQAIWKVNVEAFEAICDLCCDYGAKLVYASSASGYKIQDGELTFGRSFDTLYAYTKYINECTAQRYMKEHALETWGFRFFNVYGNGEIMKGSTASVATQILTSIKNFQEFKLFADSWTTYRDFICIEDVVRVLLDFKRFSPGIYDLGTGNPASFGEISDYIKSLFSDSYIYSLVKNPYVGKYQTMTRADMNWLYEYEPDFGLSQFGRELI